MPARRIASFVLVTALCAGSADAASRLTFDRTIRPPQSLGAGADIAVIYAIGDNEKINTFLDSFVDQANRSGTLRLLDATGEGRTFSGGRIDEKAARRLRRNYPVDVYARIASFTCTTKEHSGELGAYDEDGKRVRRKHVWVDAMCEAQLEFLHSQSLARVTAFRVHGEGTSPRETEITPDVTAVAVNQAARYAGVAAAEQITPRRVRETVALVETAPLFAQGMSLIDISALDDARRIWEEAAEKQPGSAGLRFNLAAVCEAIGDVAAAAQHYEAAKKLAPDDRRYRNELAMFRQRNGLK
jgi:tetratricopeptide (TPR) repeat protein